MEGSLVKITSLYEMYKSSSGTITKLEYYINTQLPSLLEKFNVQERKLLFLEKESNKYINNFFIFH